MRILLKHTYKVGLQSVARSKLYDLWNHDMRLRLLRVLP